MWLSSSTLRGSLACHGVFFFSSHGVVPFVLHVEQTGWCHFAPAAYVASGEGKRSSLFFFFFFLSATIRQLSVVLLLHFSGVAVLGKLRPIAAPLAFVLGCNGSSYPFRCFGGLHFLSLGTRDTGITGGATANVSSSQVALPPHLSSSVSRCHSCPVAWTPVPLPDWLRAGCCYLDPSLPPPPLCSRWKT